MAVSESTMDKSKVIAELQVNTILSITLHPPEYDGDVGYGSYSEVKLTYFIEIVDEFLYGDCR